MFNFFKKNILKKSRIIKKKSRLQKHVDLLVFSVHATSNQDPPCARALHHHQTTISDQTWSATPSTAIIVIVIATTTVYQIWPHGPSRRHNPTLNLSCQLHRHHLNPPKQHPQVQIWDKHQHPTQPLPPIIAV